MSAQPGRAPQNEFFESVVQLAQQMKANPAAIDIETRRRGESLLGLFQDPNYARSFPELREQKKRVIEMVAKDIAEGVLTLQSSSIGVCYADNKMVPYITPHGTPPRGTVVFSLNWRNAKAFHNWRSQEEKEVSQDEINNALYFLAIILSEVL